MYCQSCGNSIGANFRFCPKCGGRSLGDSPPTAPTATIAIPGVPTNQASNSATNVQQTSSSAFAGFWIRTVAYLIDLVLITIATVIVVVPLSVSAGIRLGADGFDLAALEGIFAVVGAILGTMVGWIYSAASESSVWQATPGKRLLGLQVGDSNGHRIGFGRATLRYAMKVPSQLALSLPFLLVAFRPDKRGIHDLVAGTFVFKH